VERCGVAERTQLARFPLLLHAQTWEQHCFRKFRIISFHTQNVIATVQYVGSYFLWVWKEEERGRDSRRPADYHFDRNLRSRMEY
jgi:hypothetical protein